jgi:hypothetical protein
MRENAIIAAFRRRVQSDPKLLAELLVSPLGVMKREGVQVSPQAAFQFRDEMAAVAARSVSDPRQLGRDMAGRD